MGGQGGGFTAKAEKAMKHFVSHGKESYTPSLKY